MAKKVEFETYDEAKDRLDAILTEVKSADVSLEASLDLLDEGVAAANVCTELLDLASWAKPADEATEGEAAEVAEIDAAADEV